jgi:hypothetical protein
MYTMSKYRGLSDSFSINYSSSKIVLYIIITYKERADLCVGDENPHAQEILTG